VVLTFSGVVEGMRYWEYASGIWQKISAGVVTLSGNTATFTIVDNGPYDTDPVLGRIVNQSGPGILSAAIPALPGAPVTPSVIAGDTQATISWSVPSSGGNPVRYIVTNSLDSRTCTVLAPLTSCIIDGLTNSTAYTFTVVAENSTGAGAPSTISTLTTLSSVPPTGCGLVYGISTLTAPTVNLCSTGRVASAVTASSGNFAWTCKVGSTIANCSAPGASVAGGNVKTTLELQTPSGCTLQQATLAQPDIGVPIGTTLLNGLVNYTLQNCSTTAPVLRLTYSKSITSMSIWQAMHQTWLTIPNANISGNAALFSVYDYLLTSDPDALTEPQTQVDDDPKPGTIIGNAGAGTRNLMSSSSSLVLSTQIDDLLRGQSVNLSVSGDKGNGRIDYIAEPTGGTYCQVASLGNSVLLTASGTTSGTCTVWAIKQGEATYSAQISNTITVIVK
jgi:hypothetical protein